MKNFIWVTHEFEGFHQYKDAPDDVPYLRYTHRHLFKLKVYIEVSHNERDIEFHMFKKDIIAFIDLKNFNNKSCETISNDLYLLISKKYPSRDIKIELTEDGECGVEMYYPKKFQTSKEFDQYWIGLN